MKRRGELGLPEVREEEESDHPGAKDDKPEPNERQKQKTKD